MKKVADHDPPFLDNKTPLPWIQAQSKLPIAVLLGKTTPILSRKQGRQRLFSSYLSATKLTKSTDLLDIQQINQQLAQPDFRLQTIAQLQKDFDRAQVVVSFTFDDILQQLEAALNGLSEQHLKQLLYLIDVPEINWNPAEGQSYQQKLAEVILHREALKVYLRSKFA